MIDVVLWAVAGWLFYQAMQQHFSGTATGGSSANPKLTYSNEKFPLYKIVKFWLAVAVVAFWIISIIMRVGDL